MKKTTASVIQIQIDINDSKGKFVNEFYDDLCEWLESKVMESIDKTPRPLSIAIREFNEI